MVCAGADSNHRNFVHSQYHSDAAARGRGFLAEAHHQVKRLGRSGTVADNVSQTDEMRRATRPGEIVADDPGGFKQLRQGFVVAIDLSESNGLGGQCRLGKRDRQQ